MGGVKQTVQPMGETEWYRQMDGHMKKRIIIIKGELKHQDHLNANLSLDTLHAYKIDMTFSDL